MDSSWHTQQFMLKLGTTVPDANGLTLVANPAGKVSFTLPTTGQQLQDIPLLNLSLDGPSPLRTLVFWESEKQKGKVFQMEIRPSAAGTSTYNLGDLPDWDGAVKMLGIELHTLPNQTIKLRKISLSRSSLANTVRAYIHNWNVDHSWRNSDVNFITGTPSLSQPPYPAPIFAGLTAFALALLWMLHLLRRSSTSFNWGIAGCVILFSWIISDTFWQMRLWNQVSLTWDTFRGKTTGEKLLALRDAQVVSTIGDIRARIPKKDARVFIASSSDEIGMLSAYYISPLNTYWHRRGPELPAGDVFNSGDYILIIGPSEIEYDSKTGTVHRPGEGELKVQREYRSAVSVLFRVI